MAWEGNLRQKCQDVRAGMDHDMTDGEIGNCGHWDNELDHAGYCKDNDCRSKRFIAALLKGEAGKRPDGSVWWIVG